MGGVSSWVSEAPWGFIVESVTINEGGSVRFVDCGTPTEKTPEVLDYHLQPVTQNSGDFIDTMKET